jgi:hypothetical protein
MKEIIASIPVPPKMYRHFAVITLLITACIAIFADGERREAMADEFAEQQQRQALREADATQNGPKKIVADPTFKRGGGGFGSEGVADPGGSSAQGQSVGVATADGRNEFQVAQRHDMGVLRQPGAMDLSTGPYLPPQSKKGQKSPLRKQPSMEERRRLLEAAAARAGTASD